jgi:endonuclease YncB( thermonuclease family)
MRHNIGDFESSICQKEVVMARKEKVTRVIDGDTFETSSRKKPVRLARLDAPEKGQRGAAQARKDLSSMILGKEVSIDTVARDKYGRAVANVKVGRSSVNKAMKENLEG